MADDVKVTIGAEGKGATTEIDRVSNKIEALRTKAKKGFFDPESENKIKRNLGALVGGLAQAETASEALAITFSRLENVIQSSVAGAVVVAGFSALYSAITANEKAANAFRDALVNARKAFDAAFIEGNVGAQGGAIKQLFAEYEKDINRLSSKWEKLKQGLITGLTFGLAGNSRDEQLQRTEQAMAELDRMRTEKEVAARQDAADKIEADRLKAEDDLNGKIVKEELASIAERNALQEAEWKKQDEKELSDERAKLEAKNKMAFQAQKDEEEFRKQQIEEMAEFEIKKAKEVADKKEEIATKRALRDAEAGLPGAMVDVANAEALMEKVQGGRAAAGAIGLFKGGASLPEQRASQRFYDRQAEINAGVVARDELRRSVGGDADALDALKRQGAVNKLRDQILGKAGKDNPEQILKESEKHLADIKDKMSKLQQQLGRK